MILKRILITLGTLILLAVLGVGAYIWRQTQSGGEPDFFESEIADFEAADREGMPAAGGILFTGSSSIRLWSTLVEDMAPLPVIQRGFGGAHMEHVVYNARRVVTPYRPRAVVVFVGGNDIGSGKTASHVARDFRDFLEIVASELPDTDVWLLSMKPSKLRWDRWGEMKKLDTELRTMAEADSRVTFVETGRALLGPDGTPDDVYMLDGLHLNAEGYRRWTEVLRPRLLEAYASELPPRGPAAGGTIRR